jgi:MFS family permease
LIVAVQNLPTVFLAGWGGSLADRLPRRAVVLVTQATFLLLALALTGFVFAGLTTPWPLLGFAFLGGIVHAVDLPTRLALVKDMVERDDLVNATALNSLQFNVARIVGPWLGGLVLAGCGPWPCFLANALSYAAVLAALAYMVFPAAPRATSASAPAQVLGSGLVYLARQPGLATLILLAGAVSFCGWPFLELLPALARKQLGVEELGYSRMLSGTGVGALTAAFTVATFGSERTRRPALALGVAAVIAGLLGLSFSQTLGQGVVCSGVIGFGLILFLTTAQSTVQLAVRDEHRGRVLGVWVIVWSGAPPLANLLLGPAADLWGEATMLRAQGLGLATSAVMLLLVWWTWTAAEGSD